PMNLNRHRTPPAPESPYLDNRYADPPDDEAALLEHPTPARPGQPAGDSTGPEVDVLGGGLRYRPPVGDVGELQPAAGPEHPPDLAEHGALVRTQIDDAVGDHHVSPAVLDRERL